MENFDSDNGPLQYATTDNSSLIPYYNTQSELKVLTFDEITYY